MCLCLRYSLCLVIVVHVKALQSDLEDQASEKDSDTAYSQAVDTADSLCQPLVTGQARSALDLKYLFNEGTESSV